MESKMSGANAPGKELRVAVLSDIHGNIRALDAVLEEVENQQVDTLVFCGDVASGPFPGETLIRLMELAGRAHFVRGNSDRELVSACDGFLQFNPTGKETGKSISAWSAQFVNQSQRDFLASFEENVVLEVRGLGKVLFCHGSPRSDEQIITSLTPEADLEKILAGVNEKVIVCGHTHHQFDLRAGRYRVINSGSVGMPYEGKPGAYWAILGPAVEFRRSEYDAEKAVEESLETGYPDLEYRETLLTPPKADEVAAYFENVAIERGERK